MTREPEHTCHDERRAIEDAFLGWIRPIEETKPDRLDCFTAGYAAGRKAALPSEQEIILAAHQRAKRQCSTGNDKLSDAIQEYIHIGFEDGVRWLASRIEGE
jgi:hypothetical protein